MLVLAGLLLVGCSAPTADPAPLAPEPVEAPETPVASERPEPTVTIDLAAGTLSAPTYGAASNIPVTPVSEGWPDHSQGSILGWVNTTLCASSWALVFDFNIGDRPAAVGYGCMDPTGQSDLALISIPHEDLAELRLGQRPAEQEESE